MKCTRHVALNVKMRNTYNIFVGTPEGKRPLERPRHRWETSRVHFPDMF
jgi:hypothetical protein